MTVTLAPLASACFMVGSDATMRASLVTTPACTGTLRSARIKTRLPLKSTAVMGIIWGVCIVPTTYNFLYLVCPSQEAHTPITCLVAATTAAEVIPQTSSA